MSLSDNFNNSHTARKISDAVLQVGNGAVGCYFDFTLRILYTGGGTVTPFSQLDREVLVMVRDRLVELGGKPPELPPEAPATQAPARKFNL